jgi:hypothetical protein
VQQPHLNMLDTLQRVQAFLDAQATVLGAVVSPTLRTRLNDAATQLAAFQVEQSTTTGAAKGETANQAVLRKEFFADFMKPIAKIAKGSLKTAPELPVLTVASGKLRNGDFAGAAQSLADAAAKYESTFVSGGLAPDFLTQLRAAIAQLNASKVSRDGNLGQRAAATKGIADSTKTANEVLVVLDSAISKALKGNASLLAGWKSTRKIAVATTALPAQPTGLPVAGTSTATTDTTTASPVVAAPTATGPAAPVAAPTVAPPSTT